MLILVPLRRRLEPEYPLSRRKLNAMAQEEGLLREGE
jgi:hypothetical protein